MTAPVKLPTWNCVKPRQKRNTISTIVLQEWYLKDDSFNCLNKKLKVSHLYCARKTQVPFQVIVKLHRVFMSRCRKFGSSRTLLFRQAFLRDRAQIVTPFVQARTYLARYFATLGPSVLRPPLNTVLLESLITNISRRRPPARAGLHFSAYFLSLGRHQTLYLGFPSTKSWVFIKLSHFPLNL